MFQQLQIRVLVYNTGFFFVECHLVWLVTDLLQQFTCVGGGSETLLVPQWRSKDIMLFNVLYFNIHFRQLRSFALYNSIFVQLISQLSEKVLF
jgi:hypothetical protein